MVRARRRQRQVQQPSPPGSTTGPPDERRRPTRSSTSKTRACPSSTKPSLLSPAGRAPAHQGLGSDRRPVRRIRGRHPEYNHSTSPALLNALDYVYAEWNDKAVGFVSYGTSYGVRAAEHLRGVTGELQMADIRNQIRFALPGNFPDRAFTPGPEHEGQATDLFDQLELWAGALRTIRS